MREEAEGEISEFKVKTRRGNKKRAPSFFCGRLGKEQE